MVVVLPMRNVTIRLPGDTVRRAFLFLLALELAIVLLDIFVNHLGWIPVRAIRRMFNIAREDSLGTWLSSTQMLAVGLVLLLIGWARKQEAGRMSARVAGWYVLAGFFIYMGIDDAIKFHERVGTAFKVLVRAMDGPDPGGVAGFFPSYAWQLVFGPFFAAMGVFVIWFLWRELKTARERRYVFIGIGCYVAAVILDFVEGLKNPPYPVLADLFSSSVGTIRHYAKVVEEFLEMFGTTWQLVAFLGHLFTNFPAWKIEVLRKENAPS